MSAVLNIALLNLQYYRAACNFTIVSSFQLQGVAIVTLQSCYGMTSVTCALCWNLLKEEMMN